MTSTLALGTCYICRKTRICVATRVHDEVRPYCFCCLDALNW